MPRAAMLLPTTAINARYVHRIGRHHFSYLRAIANGLDLVDNAKRYLGVEHGHQAVTAHQQTVDAVRAIARRRGDLAWRLVGLSIRMPSEEAVGPTLDEFVADRGLDGWSEEEVSDMYAKAYPTTGREHHKFRRRAALRERQLALIKTLELQAAETPCPTDLVTGWFDELISKKLIAAGVMTLADLNQRIVAGGCWYRTLPAVGVSKAKRIADHLVTLMPLDIPRAKPVFALTNTPSQFAPLEPTRPLPTTERGMALLDARNDIEATEAWVRARAGSPKTAVAYRREARRLLLWLRYERGGKALSQMNTSDSGDYMAFLQNIPQRWISRERAAPGEPGWAPFRGPLSHKSYAQAITRVAGLFKWLQSAEYINTNPWPLMNLKTGDDREERVLDTKALSESASAEVLAYVRAQAPSPSRNRMEFILLFVEAVGLRSAELIAAHLGHFSLEPEGWMMQIHGKGSKNRVAAVPGQAFDALQAYLESRHLGGIETAPSNAPLLASVVDPMAPVGYQALYEHVKGWIAKAVAASALSSRERTKLAGATTHWLRHTFGTRAVARGVPLDVIQGQMGHASPQTTLTTYGRAPIQRRYAELDKAFG